MTDRQGLAASAEQHWLNAERLRIYPRIIAAAYLVLLAVQLPTISQNLASHGNQLGADFMAFWVGGRLALAGQGAQVWNYQEFLSAQQRFFPDIAGGGYGWFYPPNYLLAVTPFALLPYLAALLAFSGLGLGCWWLALKAAIDRPGWGLLAITFPGVWVCLVQGQNGLITAALAAGSLLLLRRRPMVSGVLLGLLAIKPQLAVVAVIALVAARAWRTLLLAALTAVATLALALLAFGTASLGSWLGSLQLARLATETGTLPGVKMASTFAALRLLGVDVAWSYVGHAVVALAAVLALWLIWHRSDDHSLRAAAVMVATILVTPFSYDYDLVWLGFAIAWYAKYALASGWRRGDREILLASWLLPGLATTIALGVHLQVVPLVLAAFLWRIWRRATTSNQQAVISG